jgi:hypothetical protein
MLASRWQLAAAAGATAERPLQHDLAAAGPAAGQARGFDDDQLGALGRRAGGAEVEAETHRVRQDGRELADLQDDAADARAPAPLQGDGDDLLGDAQLVHTS